MSTSSSSSDDECNIYVNAAVKLNALNRQTKKNFKDHDDEDEDEVDKLNKKSEICDVSPVNKNKNKNLITNSIQEVSNKRQGTDISRTANTESVILIDDSYIPNGNLQSRGRRTTRNSNKTNDIPNKAIDVIEIIDTVEEDLDKSYNDASLLLSQDESDNYITIGSPSPSKKTNNDNYEVSIKVLWKSNKMERFEIKRYETFQKVFRHFANLENVSEDQILITKKDKRITPFDTPVSIDWSVIDILDGGIVSAEIVKKKKLNSGQDGTEENVCRVKIQTSDKRSLIVALKHNETFATMVDYCSEQLNIPKSTIRFYCDGELIENETPDSLDFDNEACIDLKVSK